MFDRHKVKVIIPALNEAASVARVLSAVPEWVDEVLVVDNGSTDGTARIAADNGARVVCEPRQGYGQACLAGLAALGACDVVVFLDADFSDHPEQMLRLVAPIAADQADMVIGSRVLGRHAAGALALPQRLGNVLACRLMNLIWRTRYTDLGPFRAARLVCLRRLAMRDRNYGWTIEMQIKAARAGLRVREVPVGYRRRIGQSKVSGTVRGVIGAGWKILWTLFRHALCPPPLRACRPDRLIVFSRLPTPGRTKTRLIPAIGAAAAAKLQREMTAGTIQTARPLAAEDAADVEVRYTGGTRRQMRRWLGGGVAFTPQGPGDLGRRMDRAFRAAFDAGCGRAVIVGTDCPNLSRDHLRRAFGKLRDHDLVLGPSADGGYWLIGLRNPAGIFKGVEWGTPSVLTRTLRLAEAGRLSVALLEELADVDRPEDLRRWRPQWEHGKPCLSVIIPALNEAEHIRSSVDSARGDGVEIIVVDAGSSDRTARLAVEAGARVLSCPPGRATQLNRGAAEAAADLLLFLHADTRLPPGFVNSVLETMTDPRVVGGAFRHQTDYRRPIMSVLELLVHFRAKYLYMPYGDQAMFVRRDVFEGLGGFPPVPVAEDLHFARRLRRAGRVVILPTPAVTSGRRWRRRGTVRATMINQLIVVGCLLGVCPRRLARLY